ncbi:MAG: Gldg family protein [Verrucomicrobiaceae bacterium]
MKALKPALLGIAALGLILFLLSFANAALEPARWILLLVGLAALSLLPSSRIIRAAFGTAVLAALVFFITQLIGMIPLGRGNIDLTEDDRYTLTEGTKAILTELDQPVVINYYATRDLRSTPADIKRYIPRVDNLLEEFSALAGDNLIVNFIDPKPNTDEEDAAALDQIQQVPVSQDENLFFGVSIACWDKKTIIPYFNPQNETQLEFDLISAIAEVSAENKPTVGLVSALNLTTGGQRGQGWIFAQYLQRAYNLVDLGIGVTDRLSFIYDDQEWGEAPELLDPKKIPVILVIHPAGITQEAEYQLDQYLLRGGTVLACVDSFSIAAQQSAPGPQIPGMPSQGGTPTSSSLPKLFEGYGIKFDEQQVLADGKHGMQNNPTLLNYNKENMPVEDDIALASIDNLLFGYAGAFTEINAQGLEISRLIRSSRQSGFVPASDVTNPESIQNLRFKLRSTDKQYDLLVYLSGNFSTAFPDGNPGNELENQIVEKTQEEQAELEEAKKASLKTGEAKGHLYLFSDSDFLYDGAAYRMLSIGGRNGGGIPQQLSDNGPLVFNILDQATNSKYLVGARARTPNWRPFTVFQEMSTRFKELTGEKIDKLREEETKATEEIQKLQAQREDSRSPFLSEEQQETIAKLREQQVAAAKSIRELEKDYQASEDAIKSGIFWKTILSVPAIVFLAGIGIFLYRRVATQAR